MAIFSSCTKKAISSYSVSLIFRVNTFFRLKYVLGMHNDLRHLLTFRISSDSPVYYDPSCVFGT